MPHDIATIAGKPAMMYAGEVPWHGLGTPLDKPATAAEAIHAASLDWEVVKRPLFLEHGSTMQPIRNRFGVVRDDLLKQAGPTPVLGIVGAEYKPLQNRDAFQWFDPIVGEGKAIYHTAGALGDGERVWILAKLPDDIQVVGNDIAEKFLLLSNSHDGSSSVQVKFTPVRVVCQNTLTMALNQGRGIRVPHTRNLSERLAAARDALAIIQKRFDEITTDFRRMAEIQLNTDRLNLYLTKVFPAPSNPEDERAKFRVQQARQESTRLFTEGLGNSKPPVRGTLWAAFNGIAEYVDHVMNYRDANRRLDAIWFGSGYLSKARAFRITMENAGAWKN
jgi:phage/plasmid-like protein (TIGR03299 family)